MVITINQKEHPLVNKSSFHRPHLIQGISSSAYTSGVFRVLATAQDASTSGAVLFSGDAIELVEEEGAEDEPFLASYSLTVKQYSGNNKRSISNFTADTTEPEDADEDSDN